MHDENGDVVRSFGTNTDITEIREAEERQRQLLDELNHRVKNTLASVQSIAQMTMRGTSSLDEFADKLNARLSALSRSHDLLARETWQGASLFNIIRDTLSTWPGDNRVTVEDPEIRLGPTVAVTLGMAFHELATNAAKYGALSSETGRVAVVWTVDWRAEPVPAVVLSWTETGGPTVQPAERRGFGTRLIESGLARELNAGISLDFDPSGLKCWMRLPLSNKLSAAK